MDENNYDENNLFESESLIDDDHAPLEAVKKAKAIQREGLIAFLLTCFLIIGIGMIILGIAYQHSRGTISSISKKVDTAKLIGTDEFSRKTKPSVVLITAETKTRLSLTSERITQSSGSGVIIASDGIIITCEHVISDAQTISVETAAGKHYLATCIGSDKNADIAVIKINGSNLLPAAVGTSSKLYPGDKIAAVGNPGGSLTETMTEGIVYALQGYVNVEGRKLSLIRSTAIVARGDSGGGLFNASGELVGIIESKASSSAQQTNGFCLAVPIDRAMRVVHRIQTQQ